MEHLLKKSFSHEECVAGYDLYAHEVRGLAAATREIQCRILRRFCAFRFGEEPVVWSSVCFTDIVRFLTAEFEHYPNRGTQRASLTSMRTILRYLAETKMVPKGWDEALPRTTAGRHAHLPRKLSPEQVCALFRASQGNKWIARRNRALLLLLLRLGLRCEEVAHLKWKDVDWQAGSIRVCSQKSGRGRILPLPEDVGKALAAYLQMFHAMPVWVFDSSRVTFSDERRRLHIQGITHYFFKCAGVVGGSAHSLRHTVATNMVNHGASFKEVADLLGHRWLCTTFIYAKLDMKSLAQVALPWPSARQTKTDSRAFKSGGAR
jgi:site-specific recombinase XerD